MESGQHPPSSSSASFFSHQHDFSSLVSWPHHWQPESFEITIPTSSLSAPSDMTQVVPERMTSDKLGGENDNSRKQNNASQKSRPQRSNSATLSTISISCDTDTSTKLSDTRSHLSSTKRSSITLSTMNNLTAAHSTSTLTNDSINSLHTFNNHSPQKASMSTSSEINITYEKSHLASSMSIANKHSIKSDSGTIDRTGATSARNLSIKHKSTSFDDHRSTRGVGKSVLEHLVFVFPENVRRILAGPKK